MAGFKQGDLIKIENRNDIFAVVSKDYFNKTGMAMLCPVMSDIFPDPLHIEIIYENMKWLVLCEHVKMYDLNCRGYSHLGEMTWTDRINVTDAIQSIFDY